MTGSVLVTGGAGYVGSHTALLLVRSGYRVSVVDNLSTGHRAAVPEGAHFTELDLLDGPRVDQLLAAERFDAILHFAARSLVPESMQDPYAYLGDNVTAASNLLRAAQRHGIRRFVLSSTANLFAEPKHMPIAETEAIVPGSPYGESKFLIERMLHWADQLGHLRYAALRYFNAAGADASGSLGEHHEPETHLIPIVLSVALGARSHVSIFGRDYDTPDGTAVRDYVHVSDLARAHLLALQQLDARSLVLNLGTGTGHSVQEVVDVARKVTGRDIPTQDAPRRAGDPPRLVASSALAKREIGWEPEHDLQSIVESAWAWHRSHPRGFHG